MQQEKWTIKYSNLQTGPVLAGNPYTSKKARKPKFPMNSRRVDWLVNLE